jgi:chromosome segregation ATPase
VSCGVSFLCFSFFFFPFLIFFSFLQTSRLISNRESAQASRKRKKAYIEELELKVTEMALKLTQVTAKNNVLQSQMTDMTTENKLLREELEQKKRAKKDTPHAEHSPIATTTTTTATTTVITSEEGDNPSTPMPDASSRDLRASQT